MKNILLVALFAICSTTLLAQKKEKVKGTKIVTVKDHGIGSFESVELGDNLEVFLEKGDTTQLKIEADDNLHDIIIADLTAKQLKLYTKQNATSFKKLVVKLTYTNTLKSVIVKDEAVLTTNQELALDNLTITGLNDSKLTLKVDCKDFLLKSDNNSKIEISTISDNVKFELSGNSKIKALVKAKDFKCDMYQKSDATVEGDSDTATIRLDNNAVFSGKKMAIATAAVTAEGSSDLAVNTSKSIAIDAKGDSEIELYGDQTIEIKRFLDSAILKKKSSK